MEARGERRTCTILHVYRHLVFLHSRENMVDYGVWISPTRSVISVAAKERPNVSSETNHVLWHSMLICHLLDIATKTYATT